MNTLGIVGTAFRGLNTEFDNILTKNLYINKIYKQAKEVIQNYNIEKVISGGAAGIDHLAVKLFQDNYIENIDIYYPTKFNDTTSLIGKTLLKYHYNFSNVVYYNSFKSISELAELYEQFFNSNRIYFYEEEISKKYEGFFNRNKKIANNSNYLLVFSYFDQEGNCLTSGTNNTITHFLKTNIKDNILKFDIRNL